MYSSAGFLSEFKNAFNRPNNAHAQLIIINVVVFLVIGILKVILDLTVGSGIYSILTYIALPSNLATYITRPWTIITYMFTHEGLWHILWNMVMLYWFGKILIEYLGGDKVIAIYVLGGIAGGLVYMTAYNLLPLFKDSVDLSILFGASAGVLSIVVASATLAPNYTVFLMFIGPVKIKYIALITVVLSFLQSTGSNAGGEIAHLGGALIGFVYIKQLQKGQDWGNWITETMRFIKSFFIRPSNIKVSYKKKTSSRTKRGASPISRPPASSSRTDQEEIDAILDKISERGYESLSKEEKEKLFNASKK